MEFIFLLTFNPFGIRKKHYFQNRFVILDMSIEILIFDNLKISERLEVERSRNRSYIEILIFDNLKISERLEVERSRNRS